MKDIIMDIEVKYKGEVISVLFRISVKGISGANALLHYLKAMQAPFILSANEFNIRVSISKEFFHYDIMETLQLIEDDE